MGPEKGPKKEQARAPETGPALVPEKGPRREQARAGEKGPAKGQPKERGKGLAKAPRLEVD